MVKWLKRPYLILGIGVGVGVIAYAVHAIRKRNREEILNVSKDCKRITRTIKIGKGFIGHILGRGGATIRGIRERTRARISFDDQGLDQAIVTIAGLPEEVEAAAEEINRIVSGREATVTKETDLEEGQAETLWRNVSCIREICELSRAKVVLEFLPSRGGVRLLIRGRREEVEVAGELVDELVARAALAPGGTDRPSHVAGRALPLHPDNMRSKVLPCERLVPSGADGFVEVFVSAVDSPGCFWVQVSGSKSVQLDKLATEMTDFYGDERNRRSLRLHAVSPGDIVAAYYGGDESWYRAQVIKVDHEKDRSEKRVVYLVFYLDFGDCGVLGADAVAVLKPDFLSIPFQAIECRLHGVAPPGAEWTEEAAREFEKLVHLGQWKVVMARPVEAVPKLRNGEGAALGGGAVQSVRLMDTTTPVDVDVAERLVAAGLARYVGKEVNGV